MTKFFKLRTPNIIRIEDLCAVIEDQILPIPDFVTDATYSARR